MTITAEQLRCPVFSALASPLLHEGWALLAPGPYVTVQQVGEWFQLSQSRWDGEISMIDMRANQMWTLISAEELNDESLDKDKLVAKKLAFIRDYTK